MITYTGTGTESYNLRVLVNVGGEESANLPTYFDEYCDIWKIAYSPFFSGQLAYAIIRDFNLRKGFEVKETNRLSFYISPDFEKDVLEELPAGRWVITEDDILTWMVARHKKTLDLK